jgi:hypothetical protein
VRVRAVPLLRPSVWLQLLLRRLILRNGGRYLYARHLGFDSTDSATLYCLIVQLDETVCNTALYDDCENDSIDGWTCQFTDSVNASCGAALLP